MSGTDLTCDVCTRPALGVASSSFGAISFAFCKECVGKPAEPEMVFAYLFEEVSDNGDGLREGVNDFWTWQNGRYVSWPNYRDARRSEQAA